MPLIVVAIAVMLTIVAARAQIPGQQVYLPMLAQVPTPTSALPTPAPPTPTPGPNPQPEGVSVRDYQSYEQGGARYIIGEVVNNTGQPASLIKIDERFYDSDGKLIFTDYTFVSQDRVAPGARALFYDVDSAPPSGITRVEVTVASWLDRTGLDYRDITVVSHETRPASFGRLQITGELRNDQTVIMRSAQVLVTFYDEAGKVVNVAMGYASNSTLRPGETTVFTLNALRDVPFATYQIYAQGYVQL